MNLLVKFSTALAAAQAGVHVDFASILPGEPLKDAIGLMKLWDARNADEVQK